MYRIVVTIVASLFLFASTVHADAPPPTNGGNGAGMSGQCTGNPDNRPPGLDCAH
jgi:hypothetical protein